MLKFRVAFVLARCGSGTLGGWPGAGVGVGLLRGKFLNVFETYVVHFLKFPFHDFLTDIDLISKISGCIGARLFYNCQTHGFPKF